ncbi:hypothetical protein GGH91_000614 [Coemansia sp. RSA 2671]|nr:hypothetical protein GGH91_000614 [Coemansia sp. RSA 2671]
MHMSYPFHDDILLRGNAETLEYLYLCVDNDAIATLEFSLDTGTMSLFEMLSVLKAFPGLVKLTNTINGLGLELEDIAADELPDYVDSVFGNVGKHLQVWSMLFVSGYMGVKMIDYVALLMLVCPELCRAHMNGGSGEGVRAKIAEVQSSQRFSKYKLRLDKLLEAVRE